MPILQSLNHAWVSYKNLPTQKKVIIGITAAVALFALAFFGFLIASFFVSKLMWIGAGVALGSAVTGVVIIGGYFLLKKINAKKIDDKKNDDSKSKESYLFATLRELFKPA